jgi:hypothetical protein
MNDEDESTDPGIIIAERPTLKFLRDREANEAALEDRGTSTVNQFAQHPAPADPVKQKKTAEELAAMIHQDLSQIEGCPKQGVKVTVYGRRNPWNSMLTFGVDAGPGSIARKVVLQGALPAATTITAGRLSDQNQGRDRPSRHGGRCPGASQKGADYLAPSPSFPENGGNIKFGLNDSLSHRFCSLV